MGYSFIHLGEELLSGVKFLVSRNDATVRGLNPGPPDLEFEVLTTLPHTPLCFHLSFGLNFIFLSLGIW